MRLILPVLKCWTLWCIIVLLCMPLILLARQEPATQPADPRTEPAPASPIDDAIIRLPDGREVNLAELRRDGMGGLVMVRAEAGDGNRNLVITEDDRTVTIHETDEEIVVIIKDGDAEPEEYRAANAEELEQNHPEAFEVYQRYAEQLIAQLPPAGMGGVGDRVRVRLGGPGMAGMPGLHGLGGVRRVESLGIRCSPVLDPFIRAQLGEGVIVNRIEPDSPGGQIGLERWDLIKAINGQEVRTIDDVEQAVEGADKLRIEVIRRGQPVTVQE